MGLGKPGWLEQLLRQVVSTHTFDDASASAAACRAMPPGRGRARRYLRGILRESGLLYGTPQQAKDTSGVGPIMVFNGVQTLEVTDNVQPLDGSPLLMTSGCTNVTVSGNVTP